MKNLTVLLNFLKKMFNESIELNCMSETIDITALAKNLATLKSLSLCYNDIDPDGAKELANALTFNKTLETLDLECNLIGPIGTQYLVEALAQNTTLCCLDITDNAIGDDGLESIANLLKTNMTIKDIALGGCYNDDYEDARTRITRRGVYLLIDVLAINTTLTCIDITVPLDENLVLALADALRGNKQLKRIDISGERQFIIPSSIGERGLKVLVNSLSTISTLKALKLSFLSLKDISSLVDLLPQLDALDLSDNEIGHKDVAVLSDTTLKHLHLENNKLGRKGVRLLPKTLLTLNLRGNQIGDDGVGFVLQHNTLVHLDVAFNKIGVDGARAIAQYLSQPTNVLQTLDISGNDVGDIGIKAIAQALQTNTTLKKLILRVIPIFRFGGHEIGNMLMLNTTLETLDIRKTNLDDETARLIVNPLANEKSALQSLDISDNHINIATLFADVLKTNINLRSISGMLTDPISIEFIEALSDAMKINTTLVKLTISTNFEDWNTLVVPYLDRNILFASGMVDTKPARQ